MPDDQPAEACPCAGCVRGLYERLQDLTRQFHETYRTFNKAIERRQQDPKLRDKRLPKRKP